MGRHARECVLVEDTTIPSGGGDIAVVIATAGPPLIAVRAAGRRRSNVPARGAVVLACATAALAFGGAAPSAATRPPPVTVGCSTGPATFALTSTEQCYTVPAGVLELEVVAIGGQGAAGQGAASGGNGAQASAVVPVSPGESLYVEVGGRAVSVGGAYNGGGEGGNDPEGEGGGGGGASDLRTCSATASSCPAGSRASRRAYSWPAAAAVVAQAQNALGPSARAARGAQRTAPAKDPPAVVAEEVPEPKPRAGPAAKPRTTPARAASAHSAPVAAGKPEACAPAAEAEAVSTAAGVAETPAGRQAAPAAAVATSFIAPSLQNGSITTAASAIPSVTVTPLPTPPALAQASPPALSFALQAEGTVSLPQLVTISDAGQGPLLVGGVSFAGADPGDFELSSWTCGLQLTLSQSCQIGISFAPHEQGTRSATLLLSESNSSEPVSLGLSGAGGGPPAGPTGPAGPAGSAGPTGPSGARGSAAVELVTCLTVTAKAPKNARQPFVHRRSCTIVRAPSAFKLPGKALAARVVLERGHTVYATGTGVVDPNGSDKLLLVASRPLAPGAYTLRLRRRRGGRWLTDREQISLR